MFVSDDPHDRATTSIAVHFFGHQLHIRRKRAKPCLKLNCDIVVLDSHAVAILKLSANFRMPATRALRC